MYTKSQFGYNVLTFDELDLGIFLFFWGGGENFLMLSLQMTVWVFFFFGLAGEVVAAAAKADKVTAAVAEANKVAAAVEEIVKVSIRT